MTSTAEAASRYLAFQARFPTDRWTQPLGLAEHRSALRSIDFSAKTYPNTFSYSSDGIDAYLTSLAEIEAIIRSCSDLGRVADHVAEQLQRDSHAAIAVAARHDPTYAAAQRNLHGLPPEDLVRRATQELNDLTDGGQRSSEDRRIAAEELAERMTSVFHTYGLTDWFVQVEENMAAKVSVNGPLHRVRLRRNELFSSFDADRLMVHEIGGHVLRWANSRRQQEPWAAVPMGRTVATEEGLAACRELEFGYLDRNTIRKYQVRCLAVSVAAHNGIMDVIRSISSYVSRDEAVEIAIRTKRGLLDPNSPGGSTKDWGYYDGYICIGKLRESSPSDYQLLSGVKWPVEDLALVRDLFAEGRISEPQLVPDPIKLDLKKYVGCDENHLLKSNWSRNSALSTPCS